MSEDEVREIEERTNRPALRYSEPAAYDVFSPNGEFLGHVRTPTTFRSAPEPLVRGNHVWAVTRDEYDVARIVRFRVEFPSNQSGE